MEVTIENFKSGKKVIFTNKIEKEHSNYLKFKNEPFLILDSIYNKEKNLISIRYPNHTYNFFTYELEYLDETYPELLDKLNQLEQKYENNN